ncbi:MAG: hypothetical protein MI725_11970, partial [Pirellulales bacterium]|nr:hypothetical protein [Pirellulales bacterium]
MKRLHPVIVLIRSFLVFSLQIASLVAANPALASSCYDCCNNPVYSTHTSPQINGQITNYGGDPGPLEICEGQSIYLYASTTDKDKVTQYCHNSPEHCFGGPETFTSYPNDGSSADWSSNNGGSFDDPTYRNSVLWTAPTLGPGECSRTVTITATATDGSGTCPLGSCNSGNCNDGPGEQDTITIVVKKSICESATVTTTVGAFTPDPICVGETITPPATHAQACSLSASHDVQCICDEDTPTWSWQVWEVKKDGVNVAAPWHYLAIDHPDNTSSSATLKATFPSCGKWEVAVRATFFSKSECCNNQCATIGDVKWTPVTKVVGVDRIIVAGSSPEDEGPAGICFGNSVTLEAKPCPDGASFPGGKPVWTLVSKPPGSTLSDSLGGGATKTITPDVPGSYIVKAECGTSSDTFTVVAVKLTLNSLSFEGPNHTITKDGNPGHVGSFTAPHWKDNS